MATVKSVDRAASRQVIKDILEEEGCIVLENLLGGQTDRLREELQPHFEQTTNCHGDFYGYATKRLSGLIRKSAQCRDMAVHPVILDVMDEFLLRSCKAYQLNLTQAIRIGPGEPQQIIHPDDPMFPFAHPGTEAMINCMWAVDDFTFENGATHVVPGSHKWPRDRQPEPHEITQGVMTAGSVLIYFGSLLHGGGANKTDTPRTGVVLSYCLGWLRQAENHYLSVPAELVRTFPEKLQKLLGYFVHEPNLGCVEGQDPIGLAHGRDLTNRGFEEFLPDEVKPLLAEYKRQLSEAA